MHAINRQSKHTVTLVHIFLKTNLLPGFLFFHNPESPDSLDTSIQKNDESHVSGISPFFSSEDINGLINRPQTNESVSTMVN